MVACKGCKILASTENSEMRGINMNFRKFDLELKGNYIGFCIVKHKSNNMVSVKTLSGTQKQLEEEFYNYRKTLEINDITLEYAVIKNYGTVSKDYIKTRVNKFINQTKASNRY